MAESGYLRYPHVARDLITFTAEDDIWLASLSEAADGRGARAWRLTADGQQAGRALRTLTCGRAFRVYSPTCSPVTLSDGSPARGTRSWAWPANVKCTPSGIPAMYAEDVMAVRQQWGNLSKRDRGAIGVAAVAEVVLAVAALIDIKRRAASQIRGSKRMWRIALAFPNLAVPISYFAFGRRRQPRSQRD